MILDLPHFGPTRVDDSLSQEEFAAQLKQLYTKHGLEVPRSEMSFGEMGKRAIKRGAKQLGSALGDVLPAMGASALGFDDYAKRQMEEAAQTQREIDAYYAPQYKSTEDVRGISDVPGFVFETAAEQVPNLLTTLIPGVGLEVAAARGIAGAAAKEAAVRGLTGAAARQYIEQTVAASAGKKAAAQGVGVYLGSYAQAAPEIFENIYNQTGEFEPAAALLFGSASAALDSVLPAQVLKSLTGPVKVGVVEKLLEKSGMQQGLLRSVTSGVLKGVSTEGLTEGAQEAIGLAAEKFVDANREVFNSEGWNRILESTIRGAAAGGAFGAVGGAAERARTPQQTPTQQQTPGQTPGQTPVSPQVPPQVPPQTPAAPQTPPLGQTPGQTPMPPQTPISGVPPAVAPAPLPPNLNRTEAHIVQTAQLPALGGYLKIELIKSPRDQNPAYIAALQQRIQELGGTVPEAPEVPTVAPKVPAVVPKATPPAVVKKSTALAKLTPETAPAVINQNVLATLGIGPTAVLRREGSPLLGLDISNIDDAREVKRILEARAENAGENQRNRIEAYLARPEFRALEGQGATNESAITGPIAGKSKRGVSGTGPVLQREQGQRSIGAGRVNEAGRERLGTSQTTAESTDVREDTEPPTVEEEHVKHQKDIVDHNSRRVSVILGKALRDMAREVGVPIKYLPREDYTDTEPHKLLRIPALFNEYVRIMDALNHPETAATQKQKADYAQRVKRNRAQLGVIQKEIAGLGKEMKPFFADLIMAKPEQRGEMYSEINKYAIKEFAKSAHKTVNDLLDATPEAERQPRRTYGLEDIEKLADEIFSGVKRPGKEKVNEEYVSADTESYVRRNLDLPLPKYVGPELDALGKSFAHHNDLDDLLGHLAKTIGNSDVARVLRKIQALGLKTKIRVGVVENDNAGVYSPTTDTITLHYENGLNAHTVIHEVIHAAISHVLRNPNHPLTKEFQNFFVQVQDRIGAAYGATDLQEFAAELLGNPEFQALLKGIKAPRSGNMFQRIVQAIAEFFGLRKGQSAYEAGLKFVSDAIDISSDVKPTPTDDLFFLGNFGVVGQVAQAMPQLTKQAANSAANTISNVKDVTWKQIAMGLLRLDNINTIYGDRLPSIQKLLDALEKRNGVQEQSIAEVNKKYKGFKKVQEKYSQQMDKLNDIAVEARMAELDILSAGFNPTSTQMPAYSRLRREFAALDPEVQQVYKDIREEYDAALKAYETLVLNSVTPSLKAKLVSEFQTRKRIPGYIPFLRRGEFWVEYADPQTGDRTATAFESIRERQQFINQMLVPQNIQHKSYQNLEDISFDPNAVPTTSFIGKVIEDLRANGASQQQVDAAYQAYISLFPADSIAKQFLKSKNVLGMEKDIVRGYGDVMVRWKRKLANSEYSPQIDKAISEIEAQAANANDIDLDVVAQNIKGQSNFFHNPTYNDFVHGATALSYYEYIAGNISSAIINLTSLPLLAWPMLGGQFGFGKTSAKMANAHRVMVNGELGGEDGNLRYAGLYAALMDHGQLEHTMAREVLEGRRQKTSDYLGLKAKILDGIALPFSAAEKYNRGVTAVAAFDLAIEKGMDPDAAIRFAVRTVKDIHTSGMAATAPRWMQHPVGRVFATFKSFAWNSAFILARAFHQAFKGQNADIRAAARRQLLATYGMSTMFLGIKGMPFYGALTTLATMLQALAGDDDEPFDVHEELRQAFGEFLYKGAFNYITNLEVANRSGLATDLIFRDDPRGVAEHGYVLSAMQQAFGPAGTYAINVGNSIKMFQEGNVERAIEGILPSAARNVLKGARYLSEGALTLKGDPVDEDISAYNGLMQMIGFSPADLSSTYEKVSGAKSYEREVIQRRTKLLNMYNMGYTGMDGDLMDRARDEIMAFNEARPEYMITGSTLMKSIKARQAAERNMLHGVTFNKKLKAGIEDKFFDED